MEEKKPETDTFAICKKCGEKKVRNCVGKYPNGRDKKYAELDGRLWTGLKCGDCVKSHMGNHMKVKRSKKLN